MAQYRDPTTEGSEGVPLRFPRPAMVGIAIGLTAAWTVLGSMPASADSVRQHEWWLSKLSVTSAWKTSRGTGVTVAVLADGVNPDQPDLANSVRTGPDFTRSGRAASGAYFGLQGTPIASLIAGHGHGTGGSEGIIGVAPDARILSVRVTLSPGDPLQASSTVTARLPAAIAAGIRYSVRKGASVIDLPIDPGQPGASGTGSAAAAAGGSAAEKAAVSYARSKGVVLVAPAGDNGAGTDAVNYPAAYPGVIAVGAFDHGFMKAAYSSRQRYVTLTAAGEGVIAATEPGSYATVSSTSAASAIVAGIAALIRSRFPELSPARVTRALIHSTVFRRPGGIADGSGYGAANAARALKKASVIAGPLARRTPAKAATQGPPTPPAVPSAASSLAPKVLRAVVISAGVLILLLLPITAYAAVSRRRARRAARAGWRPTVELAPDPDEPASAGPASAGYAYAGADLADPMLEFFAAPARPPDSAPAATAAASEPGWSAGADSPAGPRFLAGHGRADHGRHAGTGPSAARTGPSAARTGPSAARTGPSAARTGPSAARTGSSGPAFAGSGGTPDTWPGSGDPPSAGDPASPGGFGPFGGRDRRSSPASPAGDGGFAAADSVPGSGDPFGSARDPFGSARDPFGPAADPFGPAADPFGPAADPFGRAGDSFRPTADPPGPAGDPPGAAGRSRPASRDGAGSPVPRPVSTSASPQARISGAPPWEPAAKPESELPWANGPAPHAVHPVSPMLATNPARAAHRRVPRQPLPPAAPPAPSAAATPPPRPAPAPAPPAPAPPRPALAPAPPARASAPAPPPRASAPAPPPPTAAPRATSGAPWPDAPAPLSPAPWAADSIWDVAARDTRKADAGGGDSYDYRHAGSADPARRADSRADSRPGPASRADSRPGPASRADQASGPDLASTPDPASNPDPAASSADPGTGPIYVWNPGASTESFPAVPVDRD